MSKFVSRLFKLFISVALAFSVMLSFGVVLSDFITAIIPTALTAVPSAALTALSSTVLTAFPSAALTAFSSTALTAVPELVFPFGAPGILPLSASAATVEFNGSEYTGSANQGTFAINGENPRANYYPYEDEATAIANHTLTPFSDEGLTPNTPFIQPLNGTWKFNYAVTPATRPWPGNSIQSGFETNGFNDGAWDDISVPGSWQATWDANGDLKYDRPIYTNVTFPWAGYGNNASAPNTPTAYNGVGTYRRTFVIPAEWKTANRSVFLNFDGASTFYFWINGNPAGYSEDAFTRHEFDITPFINYDGENTIVVQVIRWSIGSWFEDQDMIDISGIFRNIYMIARQKVDLFDFEVKTVPVADNVYDGDWKLDVTALLRDFAESGATAGRDLAPVSVKLFDGDGVTLVASDSKPGTFGTITTPTGTGQTLTLGQGYRNTTFDGARVGFSFTVPNAKTWNAEHPNLYYLVLQVGDEVTCIRIGFREMKFTTGVDGRVLINGSRILFYGVNIHEFNPLKGRTLSLDLIRSDVTLMKQYNVNAIRMSHYPHDTRYYDLADEYGLYIMDEANIECHGNTGLSNNTAYGPMLRDREANMLERTKNYPSVVSWSVGNESGGGANFRAYAADWIRRRDPSRPIHCQFDSTGTPANYDMVSQMYATAASWEGTVAGATKPAVLCEYMHSMGNSGGGWTPYIDIFNNYPLSMGGFVWDWVDQSLLTPIAKVKQIARDAAHPDNLITATEGAVTANANGYVGNALSGYVTFAYNSDYALTNNLTVDVDVYSTGGAAGTHYSILGKGDNQWMIKEYGNTIQWFIKAGTTGGDDNNGWQTINFTMPSNYQNNWHRLTGTYADNKIVLYLDGVKVGERTTINSVTEQAVSIGVGSDNGGRRYSGYIGNARVLKRALTDLEVAASTPASTDSDVVFKLELYDDSQATWEASYDADSFLGYGGTWGDNPNDNNFCGNGMILADRTPKPQVDEMKYQYRMLTVEPKPDEVEMFDADLIHPANTPSVRGGTIVNDFQGYAGGALKGRRLFPNISDYQLVDNFTVDLYVYPVSGSGTMNIFEVGNDNAFMVREDRGVIDFTISTSAGWRQLQITQPAGYLGAWQRLTATYSGGTMRLYLNGTQIGTRTDSGAIRTATTGIALGYAVGFDRAYDGYIASARMLNKALSASEINASSPMDAEDAVFLFIPQMTSESFEGVYNIYNKYLFTNANEFDMSWELLEDNKVIQSESGISLDLAPAPSGVASSTMTSVDYTLPFTRPDKIKRGAEYILNIYFSTKTDTPWAKAGHVVSMSQIPVNFEPLWDNAQNNPQNGSQGNLQGNPQGSPPGKWILPIPTGELTVDNSTNAISIIGNAADAGNAGSAGNAGNTGYDFELSIDKASGAISSYKYNGRTLLVSGPEPNFWRAPTDDDMNWGGTMDTWRSVAAGRTVTSVAIDMIGDAAVVSVKGAFPAKSGSSYETTYTVYPNGEVNVNEKYTFGTLASNYDAPVIGTTMTVKSGYENITWYGRGGGFNESYSDRYLGSPIGIWNSTVAKSYTNHLKPQISGNKVQTRWLTLTDNEGYGLAVKSGGHAGNEVFISGVESTNGLVEFNALHYSQDALTSTKSGQHYIHQIKPSDDIFLQVNLGMRGVHHEDNPGDLRIFTSGKTFEYNYSFIALESFDEDAVMTWSKTSYGAELETALRLEIGESGLLTAWADYYPEGTDPSDVIILVALYASDNRLISVHSESASALPYDLSVIIETNGAAKARAFLWNNITFAPLLEAKELKLQ